MSFIKEEDLNERLQLFESVLAHASISWNESHCISVLKRSDDFQLPAGEYQVNDLIDNNKLDDVIAFHQSIGSGFARRLMVINFKGKKFTVKCCVSRVENEIKGILVTIPEKDNSIRYLQNAAHDFRSPLGSVLGAVNLMQHSLNSEDNVEPSELITYLDMIKLSTDKALDLANEIVELAEIESDKYLLKTKSVVMKDFVQRYLDTHRLLTLKKRIKVAFDCQTEANVLINESKMTRALDNVVTNSVKFSKEGTNITFRLTERDGMITLSIVDQGIGMSKRILDNLFVKFGEAKRNGLNGEPSHGLGMSIVRQIMRLHSGDILISSEEMKGTQVDLILTKSQ